MDIKAIETVYKGYRFRSRLEARWAVFFDAANIKYEYEPEGFELDDGTRYLPDFYLPEYDWYAEVKARRDGAVDDLKRAERFVGDKIKVLLLLGNIPPKTEKDAYHYYVLYKNPVICDVMVSRVFCGLMRWIDQEFYSGLTFIPDYYVDMTFQKTTYILHESYLDATHDRDIEQGEYRISDAFITDDDGGTEFINSCYDAARQARFEHGEHGAVS